MPEQQRLMSILRDHHRDILDLLAQADETLKLAVDSRAHTMASLRWRLVRLLRSYQLFKHISIFDPISQGDDADRAKTASGMKERCVAASDSYERHVLKWSLDGVEDAWPSYQADKLAIIKAIRNHLDREGRETQILLGYSAGNR